MFEFFGLVEDIVYCIEFELVFGVVDVVFQIIVYFCVFFDLQNVLIKVGVLWYVIDLFYILFILMIILVRDEKDKVQEG